MADIFLITFHTQEKPSVILDLLSLLLIGSIKRVLDGMAGLEPQVHPVEGDAHVEGGPGEPDVERRHCVLVDVSCVLSVLPAKDRLCHQDANSEPSEPALDEVVLPLGGVPRLRVFVTFTEGQGTQGEPHEQAEDGEGVHGRDQQVVHEEEVVEEPRVQENLHVDHDSPLLVAVEHFPVHPALLSLDSQEVVSDHAELALDPQAQGDGGDVRKENIANDVVPPALPEVRQDVLPGELDHLVENVPEVEDVEITNDEGG